MMTAVVLLGLLLGVRHALEADHVAAVATLVVRGRGLGATVRLGAAWGLGHTLTLFAVGGAVIVSGQALPDSLARLLEAAVGVMLVGLGLDVLVRLVRDRVHFHAHRHGARTHFHAHSHAGAGAHADAGAHAVAGAHADARAHADAGAHADEGAHAADEEAHRDSAHDHRHPRMLTGRALAVGAMHGLAGSAVLVLLALGGTGSAWAGFGTLALFGVGSIAGMALFTCALALPLRYAARHLTWAHNGLAGVIGTATTVMGVFIVYRVLVA